MKALTVRQPWASLIISGAKRVENRSWPTRHRGPLAIHAGKHNDGGGAHLPRGALLGWVNVTDCHLAGSPECNCTDYASPTGWHWVLDFQSEFYRPIPAIGRQGLWDWSDTSQPQSATHGRGAKIGGKISAREACA